MKISFASPDDEPQVKDLLNECGLPFHDIPASHLLDFLVLKDEAGLAGVVGLELFGQAALLRSPSVRSAWPGI